MDDVHRAAVNLATVALAPVVLWAVNRLLGWGSSGVATQDDIRRIERRIGEVRKSVEFTRDQTAKATGKPRSYWDSWKASDVQPGAPQ